MTGEQAYQTLLEAYGSRAKYTAAGAAIGALGGAGIGLAASAARRHMDRNFIKEYGTARDLKEYDKYQEEHKSENRKKRLKYIAGMAGAGAIAGGAAGASV